MPEDAKIVIPMGDNDDPIEEIKSDITEGVDDKVVSLDDTEYKLDSDGNGIGNACDLPTGCG